VKARGSTSELHPILPCSSTEGVTRILGVAVKCVDIERNTKGVGRSLGSY
jgi:hypothetical protein